MEVFVKRRAAAPAGFFALEAAGLGWLGSVTGGLPCVKVLDYDDGSITLQRLSAVSPSPSAAGQFGRRLAVTHDAGAAAFGAGPDGWAGPGFFGPLNQPLPMSFVAYDNWGEFYAFERVQPMAEMAAPRLPEDVRRRLAEIVNCCAGGYFDDSDGPGRLHGDLWSGNVLWTADGVVLIDPAAQGGHRETDLAMLALFGCPFLDQVISAYQQVHPLSPGWQARVGLHQLYPLLAHVVLFGDGYVGQTAMAARSVELP